MASLGRLIFVDQPGTGASDPVTPGAQSTLEQWTDSVTASNGGSAPAALFAATHPSRTTALVVLDGYAATDAMPEELRAAMLATRGRGEMQHAVNPDMPWNEEIRATWARHERLAASPEMVSLVLHLATEFDVRATLPAIRVPTLVLHHTDDR